MSLKKFRDEGTNHGDYMDSTGWVGFSLAYSRFRGGKILKNAFKLMPRGLRSLLDYISPAAFEVVDWQGVVAKLAGVSKELLWRRNLKATKARIEPILPPEVEFAKRGDRSLNSPQEKAQAGETLLALYFRQLYFSETIFLDLRADRFQYQGEGALGWEPTGLWVKMEPSFVRGVRTLYDGFYQQDDALMDQGLAALNLVTPTMSDQTVKELKSLLHDHFGAGLEEPVAFSVEKFADSFDKLFLFLKGHRVKIGEDFLFLGIYLVTLYLHLDELGQSYDVQAAYHRGTRGR